MITVLFALIPTILFILIVLWGFLLGLARGLRKSIILLIQAAVAFIIALIFYLVIVNNPASDQGVVSFVNNFMGQNGLQRTLNVSETNVALTDIITEILLKNINYGEGITLALQENANYLATLVNLIYHLVFFFISLLIYDVLLFIFYLIYVIFYPERRHKKKNESKEVSLDTDKKYKKRSLWGGLVGFLRGLVVGLVTMSFVGATLFMIGGGAGEKQYKTEYNFGDENKNRLYNVYEALGSYGNHGILKVLSLAKDKNEVPYYFFAANIVISGHLTDQDLGINEDINFATEIGQYTRLARDVFDLMMETDSQAVIDLINGQIKADDDRIFAILGNANFQTKFSELIQKFDGGKYFINFALSMLDSVALHLDKMDFANQLDPKTREILLVLLKNDHYSEYVPEDKTKQQNNEKVDTLYLSHFLDKQDVNNLLNVVLKIISLPKNTSEGEKVRLYSDELGPVLKKLSILTDPAKKVSFNKVMERLFVAVDNLYKPAETTQLTVEKLELMAENQVNVDWADELINLFGTLQSAGNLFSNMFTNFSELSGNNNASNIVSALFKIFHGENSTQTIALYDDIEAKLKASKIVDKVLSISFINQQVLKAFTAIYPDIYIPENIVFSDNGETPGELSLFLSSFRLILENANNEALINKLITEVSQLSNKERLITVEALLENLALKNSSNKSVIDNLSSSKVMQVLASSLIFANKDLGSLGSIYLPDSVFVTVDGQKKELIKMEELGDLFNLLPKTLDLVVDYIDVPQNEMDIDKMMTEIRATGNELLDNVIIEGTISDIIRRNLSNNEYIKIPTYLSTTEAWLSTDTEKGELDKIIDAKNVSGLIINDLINNGTTSAISTIIKSLNEKITVDGQETTKIEKMCESGLIYATLSNLLDMALTDELVDPNAKAYSKTSYKGDFVYSMDEIKALIDVIGILDLDISNINLTTLMNNIKDLNNIPDGKDESKLSTLYKSTLATSMLYIKLNDVISSSELLVDSNDAKDYINGNIRIYTENEISSIVSFFAGLGDDVNINSINLDSFVLNDSTIENICDSMIITASISKALIDKDVLKIPKSSYDYNYRHLVPNELESFLKSICNGLGITDVSAFDASSIKMPQSDKIDTLLNSDIMRATISSMIKSDGNDIYVATTDAILDQTFDANDYVLVSKDELVRFINGFKLLSNSDDYNVTINTDKLKALSDDDLNTVLSSSILHVIISNFVVGIDPLMTVEQVAVYDINTTNNIKISVATKEAITAYVAALRLIP